MKTVYEILTDPNPSERDLFVVNTARTIVQTYPQTAQHDNLSIARAFVVSEHYQLYNIPLTKKGFALLYARIAEACTILRRTS